MSIKLVAFCGAKESGKSTSASLFQQFVPGATQEVAFAGHLKVVCSNIFGIGMNNFLDTKLKEAELDNYVNLTPDKIKQVFEQFEITQFDFDTHIRKHVGQVFDTPRRLLQYIGTELLHPLDKLIHINYALKKIDPDAITLITDLRFPQEFDSLHERSDFLGVYVHNTKAESAAAADSHASERGWQQFKDRCVTLENDGTLQELIESIQKLIKEKL